MGLRHSTWDLTRVADLYMVDDHCALPAPVARWYTTGQAFNCWHQGCRAFIHNVVSLRVLNALPEETTSAKSLKIYSTSKNLMFQTVIP